MEAASQADPLMPELCEETLSRLVNLETQSRLHSLTMVELRGIMKQLNRPTKGTKHVLLAELSKFLQSKHCFHHFSSVSQDVRLSVRAASDERGCKRTHAQIDVHSTSTECVKLETTRVCVDHDAASVSVLAHKKPKPDWVAYDPASMRPPLATAGHHKIISWNVNGLRALLKRKDGEKHALARLAQAESFDVLCLQETKLQEKDVEGIKSSLLGDYPFSFWSCSTSKLGYSGSAVISRTKPLAVTFGLGDPAHDKEGRVITAEFDAFYLVNAYVPNSGQKLERLEYRTNEWDPAFSNFLMDLQKKKPVILTGDLNCAHQEMDIHDPDRNRRSAGFTDEERASFEAQFLRKGLVDTFRKQHPKAVAYTYWNYRTGARRSNKGWRLDYFLVSETLVNSAADSYTIPDSDGSDHCPVGLILHNTHTGHKMVHTDLTVAQL